MTANFTSNIYKSNAYYGGEQKKFTKDIHPQDLEYKYLGQFEHEGDLFEVRARQGNEIIVMPVP